MKNKNKKSKFKYKKKKTEIVFTNSRHDPVHDVFVRPGESVLRATCLSP